MALIAIVSPARAQVAAPLGVLSLTAGATSEPQDGPVPMRLMKAAASTQGDALPVEPGKATVTATVSGTVQLK